MAHKSAGAGAAWISDVVERWIGLSRPVPRDAIQQAGFVPDSFEAYCARCGESVGPGEATPDGCGLCRGRSEQADAVIRLGAYGLHLQEWIGAVKYEAWAEMGEALGHILAQQVSSSIGFTRTNAIVVPVPMPLLRRIYRGIDHARVIAEAVAHELRVDLFAILAKRNGEPQVAKSAGDRRRGRKDWMRVRWRFGGWPLQGVHVILVDDVKTSGATLRTAAKLLRGLGAKRITAAVLAVADSPARRSRLGLPQSPEAKADATE